MMNIYQEEFFPFLSLISSQDEAPPLLDAPSTGSFAYPNADQVLQGVQERLFCRIPYEKLQPKISPELFHQALAFHEGRIATFSQDERKKFTKILSEDFVLIILHRNERSHYLSPYIPASSLDSDWTQMQSLVTASLRCVDDYRLRIKVVQVVTRDIFANSRLIEIAVRMHSHFPQHLQLLGAKIRLKTIDNHSPLIHSIYDKSIKIKSDDLTKFSKRLSGDVTIRGENIHVSGLTALFSRDSVSIDQAKIDTIIEQALSHLQHSSPL